MSSLNIVYSWPFLGGLLLGVVGYQAYWCSQALYLNKHHPLPDGVKRHLVRGFNQVWISGLITLFILGYVLHLSQKTHDDTVALSHRTAACQAELLEAIDQRAKLATEDTNLSNVQQDLRSQGDVARNTWLGRLLNPPPDIDVLEESDPRRQAWDNDVTRVYADRGKVISAQIKDVLAQRKKIQADREINHPIPPADCGQDSD